MKSHTGIYEVQVESIVDSEGNSLPSPGNINIQIDSAGAVSDVGSPSFSYTSNADGSLTDVAGNIFHIGDSTRIDTQ